MPTRKTLFLLLLGAHALLSAHAQESDFRTFSDATGREMQAKIIQVNGDEVQIRRVDGLSSKVDIKLFSVADQAYIRDWAKTAAISSAIIDLSYDSEKVEQEDFSERKMKGLLEKTWEEKVGIKVKNSGVGPLSDLRVEYRVFKFESELAAEERKGGSIKRISGSARIETLQPREEKSIGPDPISMRETKLKGNFYWTAGGERESGDRLYGVWAKVFIGDRLVKEFCSPKDLFEKEKWGK